MNLVSKLCVEIHFNPVFHGFLAHHVVDSIYQNSRGKSMKLITAKPVVVLTMTALFSPFSKVKKA